MGDLWESSLEVTIVLTICIVNINISLLLAFMLKFCVLEN